MTQLFFCSFKHHGHSDQFFLSIFNIRPLSSEKTNNHKQTKDKQTRVNAIVDFFKSSRSTEFVLFYIVLPECVISE